MQPVKTSLTDVDLLTEIAVASINAHQYCLSVHASSLVTATILGYLCNLVSEVDWTVNSNILKHISDVQLLQFLLYVW